MLNNLIRKKKYILLILILLFNKITFCQNIKDIVFNIETIGTYFSEEAEWLGYNNEYIVLDFHFDSNSSDSILLPFDYFPLYPKGILFNNAISEENFSTDTFNLKDYVNSDLSLILNTITYNQFIIENIKGELRFMYTGNLFGIKTKSYFYTDLYSQSMIELIEIPEAPFSEPKNFIWEMEYIKLNKNDLRINSNDSIVRLHYLFKNEEDIEKYKEYNFHPFILTSNWFNLNAPVIEKP